MWGWLTGSSPKPKEVADAEKYFTKEELHGISTQFKSVLSRSHADSAKGERGIPMEAFLHAMCGLPKASLAPSLGQALFNAVCKRRPEAIVTEGDIVMAKAHCERMGEEVSRDFCFGLLASASGCSSQRYIPEEELQHGLAACARLALGNEAAAQQVQIAAVAAGACKGAEQGLDVDAYGRWSKSWPAFHQLLSSLLKLVGTPVGLPDAHSAQHMATSAAAGAGSAPHSWASTPQLQELGRAAPSDLLLQPLWSWMLSSCMPEELKQDWRCLFSSQRDGKSFNTMLGRLSTCQGPSLVVVRDQAGGTFGGYAPAPWAKSGTFFGDYSTFIFRLLPSAQVFRATGINEHFQWCGVGFRQLPNGIGFGGAQGEANMGQFALYVDSTLDGGMSRPIATFGNDPLSQEQVFQVSVIECWQLRPNEDDEPSGAGSKPTSVLDKKAEDRVLMSLAGMKVGNSEGLRPEPPIED